MPQIPTMVISGPVGVGKTTAGNEVSTLLEQRGIPHSFIDLDGLAATYPRPPDDRFGTQLALRNLRDVWANCQAAGSRNLIIARVIETPEDLTRLHQALPSANISVCQLRASDQTLIDRVRRREQGSDRDWHEARALELARNLPNTAPANHIVETDGRDPADIAIELADQVHWSNKNANFRSD